MKIAIPDPEVLFPVFYLLSFAISLIIVLVFTNRRKIPLRSVLLMLTTLSLLTIIGSRLFTIPLSDWWNVITSGSSYGYNGRSAVGGLIFGLAGLIFVQWYLNLGMTVIKLYSWLAPLGFAIQKIGCFFNGCCYGNLSSLPWSVQYPPGTNAHHHQWVHGIIPGDAAYSLGVHPVQLYEAIFLFIITYVVWRNRNNWKKEGSSLAFSLFLYFILKFSLEFLRDPSSSSVFTDVFQGIRIFQWFLLLAGIAFGLILLINEVYSGPVTRQESRIVPALSKSIIYAISLSLIIFIFRGMLTKFELAALDLEFVPAIILIAVHCIRSLTIARVRLAAASLMLFPVFMIMESFPQDSVKPHQSLQSFYKNDVKSYTRVDFGASTGNFYDQLMYNPQEGECGTSYTTENYEHVFRLAGMGYSKIKIEDRLTTTVGVNLFGGINRENNLTAFREKSFFLFGIDPFIKYDWNWIGFGLGLEIGNVRWIPSKALDDLSFKNGTKMSPVMPGVSVRLGRRDILDAKYNYGLGFPTSVPVLEHEVSVGSGFGLKPDYSLRYGIGFSHNGGHTFVSAEGLVHKQWGLRLKYNFASPVYFETSNYYGAWFELGANYRFGFKN
jgi:prolipoprotein diacylglyceryltransferase